VRAGGCGAADVGSRGAGDGQAGRGAPAQHVPPPGTHPHHKQPPPPPPPPMPSSSPSSSSSS
jgi:hypothetical protein